MSLKPSDKVTLTDNERAELVRYYKAMLHQHKGHGLLSGAVPIKVGEDVDTVWMSYCSHCHKFIGMALAPDTLRRQVMASELRPKP